MKRIVISLLTLVFVLALSAPVSANHADDHYWKLDTSEPQSTSQERTFNLEFVTLSTDANDDITVKLYQDGVHIGTQTTTKDFGDSGAFTVTVPADGQYTYQMVATSSVGGDTINSDNRTVEVEGREVRVVNTADAASADGSTSGGVRSASSDVPGDINGDGVVDEQDEAGQVDDNAAATEGEEADVLGEEDQSDSDSGWTWAIVASLAILAAAYYWFYYRAGRTNPFDRSDNE